MAYITYCNSNEDKIVGLFAIFEESNFVALQIQGNYTVDWGDGLVENFNSGVVAYHQYNYATYDPSNTTLDIVNKYKQAIVIITPQAGQTITKIDLARKHNQAGLNSVFTDNWLELIINGINLTVSLSIGNSLLKHTLLEHVHLMSKGTLTSLSSLLYNCIALKKVTLPSLNGVVTATSMFYNCLSLKNIPNIDTSTLTSMSTMFYGCANLKSINTIDANNVSVTGLSSLFSGCSSLTKVNIINTHNVGTMSSMFSGCTSLVDITSAIDCSSCTSGALQSTFQNCTALKKVKLININNAIPLDFTFNGCTALTILDIPTTATFTSLLGTFNSCESLQVIPEFNFSAVTAVNVSNTFTCVNLTKAKFTGLGQTFSLAGCRLSAAALNEVYTNLPTVTGKTITVTNNYGNLADDPSIATAKGWTVVG